MNRRRFIKSASGLFLAPAIVKAENIMRVQPVVMPLIDSKLLRRKAGGLVRYNVTDSNNSQSAFIGDIIIAVPGQNFATNPDDWQVKMVT